MSKSIYVKFDVPVRDYFGSINTAIAFSRLVYWSRKRPEGFYKFKQPCKKHPLYKKGDSWGEELGMTRKVLDPIFSRLVKSYSTKGQYMKAADKFDGKMFASYTNHQTSQTYYFMNQEAVDEFLGSLNIKRKEIHPPSPICKGIESKKQEPFVMSQNQPGDVPEGLPLACARLTAINTQTITSLVRDVPSEVGELAVEEEKLSSKKMVEIWNSQISDQVVWYPSLSARLYKVLVDYFGSCLESFKKYCESIASSQFLMGKAPNSKFKAFLFWVIKPEVIKSILQGAYGVKILSKIINNETKSLENECISIGYEILNVERKMEYFRKEIIDAQDKSIKEHIQSLSQEIKDQILKTVESDIEKTHPIGSCAEGLRKILINVQFDNALKNYSRTKLNLCHPDEILIPQELLDRKEFLQNRRISTNRKIQEIAEMKLATQMKIEARVAEAC